MKTVIFALIFLCYHVAEGAKWALLVAGSEGYINYRHQADICHAYQLLIEHGFPRDRIVTMMYDDIANHPDNPIQGNIINMIDGPNEYDGVRIDYSGNDVSKTNFIRVLTGRSHRLNGIGTGRSILSGPDDHIFVYYSNHGNKGVLSFPDPSGKMLNERQLNREIRRMHRLNRYAKMVFYIEACLSGSMFEDTLGTDLNVYAVTAANGEENSYACFWDMDRVAYVADEFSANWMADSEAHDFGTRTLMEQFDAVKSNVGQSQVSQFGDVEGIGSMTIGEFLGDGEFGESNMTIKDFSGNGTYGASKLLRKPAKSAKLPKIKDAVSVWDVPVMTLAYRLQHANTTEEREKLLSELKLEEEAESKIRDTMDSIAKKLSPSSALMQIQKAKKTKDQEVCYEKSVDKYLDTCTAFKKNDYNMKYLYVLSNLCKKKGVTYESISKSIEEACV